MKTADVRTPLQPHQQRVIDKLRASGGLLVAHGVGSGKTLSSIAAADALGLPIEAVVPAPLAANYEKELLKHLGERPEDARIRSYEKAVRDKDINLEALAIMDEAHRARNANTLIAKEIAKNIGKAKARLLLTGTPVYNSPSDLAILLNTAAGRRLLPDDPAMFKSTFVGEKSVQAPLLTRLKGRLLGHPVDDVKYPTLINRERLIQAAKGYVDVYKGGGKDFPNRIDETHTVEMSPKQHEVYKFHEGSMPWYLRAKIRAGLPMDKQESKDLNAFQGALRQASNTPRSYLKDMTEEEEHEHSPKIRKMVEHIQDMHKNDPNFRGVAYSNYLESGVLPLSRALTKAGITHNVFTGDVSKERRAQMVKDYNEGKTPVLLISGAGSEGLDLKGTKAVQIMEPHWNESRLEQVIGRGIRYKSHEHLPEKERQVRVMRYQSALPKELSDYTGKLIGQKPKQSIEQYLQNMSNLKDHISKEIGQALQEASDYGPLKKQGSYTMSDEAMDKVLRQMGAIEHRKGRKDVLRIDHPAGIKVDMPYDRDFMAKKIKEDFNGDHSAYADQIQNDVMNAGYAALGAIEKKNLAKQNERAGIGAAYGSLLAAPFAGAASSAATMKAYQLLENRHPLTQKIVAPAAGFILGMGLPLAAGTVGYQIGKLTHKPAGKGEFEVTQTHPLLMAPKEIKQRMAVKIKE